VCRSSFVDHEFPVHLDPFYLFLSFLDHTGWNYSLLLDLIMSPETCFLLYLVQTLKHITSCWQHWTDICCSYTCLHECTVNGNVYLTKQDGSENVGAASLRNRKRKYKNVSSYEQETLSCDNVDNLLDSKVVIAGHVPCSFDSCAVHSKAELSTDSDVQKHVIVDYSSSSDEEESNSSSVSQTSTDHISYRGLPSDSDVSHKFIKLQQTDSATSDYDHEEDTMLLLSRKDERLLGKTGSMAIHNSRCETVDYAMTVLSQLQCVISRLVAQNMFPFNVKPLIRHLRHCEVLYSAGNEQIV